MPSVTSRAEGGCTTPAIDGLALATHAQHNTPAWCQTARRHGAVTRCQTPTPHWAYIILGF